MILTPEQITQLTDIIYPVTHSLDEINTSLKSFDWLGLISIIISSLMSYFIVTKTISHEKKNIEENRKYNHNIQILSNTNDALLTHYETLRSSFEILYSSAREYATTFSPFVIIDFDTGDKTISKELDIKIPEYLDISFVFYSELKSYANSLSIHRYHINKLAYKFPENSNYYKSIVSYDEKVSAYAKRMHEIAESVLISRVNTTFVPENVVFALGLSDVLDDSLQREFDQLLRLTTTVKYDETIRI